MTRPVGAGEREVNADCRVWRRSARADGDRLTLNSRRSGVPSVQLRRRGSPPCGGAPPASRRGERWSSTPRQRRAAPAAPAGGVHSTRRLRCRRAGRRRRARAAAGVDVLLGQLLGLLERCSTCSSAYGCTVCTQRVLEEVTTRVTPYAPAGSAQALRPAPGPRRSAGAPGRRRPSFLRESALAWRSDHQRRGLARRLERRLEHVAVALVGQPSPAASSSGTQATSSISSLARYVDTSSSPTTVAAPVVDQLGAAVELRRSAVDGSGIPSRTSTPVSSATSRTAVDHVVLAGVLLALGERPVVVLGAVHQQHRALAHDDGASGDDIGVRDRHVGSLAACGGRDECASSWPDS